MEGSVIQGMLNNPEVLRSMLQANPAIREVCLSPFSGAEHHSQLPRRSFDSLHSGDWIVTVSAAGGSRA